MVVYFHFTQKAERQRSLTLSGSLLKCLQLGLGKVVEARILEVSPGLLYGQHRLEHWYLDQLLSRLCFGGRLGQKWSGARNGTRFSDMECRYSKWFLIALNTNPVVLIAKQFGKLIY